MKNSFFGLSIFVFLFVSCAKSIPEVPNEFSGVQSQDVTDQVEDVGAGLVSNVVYQYVNLDIQVEGETEERQFVMGYNTVSTQIDTLLLVFHGSGSGSNLNTVANVYVTLNGVQSRINTSANNLVVIILGGAVGSSGRAWNVGGLSNSTSDDVAFVKGVISYLQSSESPAPTLNMTASGFKVVATGHSQGSLALLNKIAPNVSFIKRISASASQLVKSQDSAFSYDWVGNTNKASKYSLQYWHGYNDPIVPLSGGVSAVSHDFFTVQQTVNKILVHTGLRTVVDLNTLSCAVDNVTNGEERMGRDCFLDQVTKWNGATYKLHVYRHNYAHSKPPRIGADEDNTTNLMWDFLLED